MGQRTLTWNVLFRALFMDGDAYDQMRDDDNPFVEGLFLLVLIGVGSALLHLIGRAIMAASTPGCPPSSRQSWMRSVTVNVDGSRARRKLLQLSTASGKRFGALSRSWGAPQSPRRRLTSSSGH